MNGRKQFHPWPTSQGEKPLVAAAYDAVVDACTEMVVVLGHRGDEVAAALEPRQFHRCPSDPDAPMFASVQAGIRAAREIDDRFSVLLHPADHPEVAPLTLTLLMQQVEEHPDLVVIPEYESRGGHPVVIPAAIAESLLSAECPQGLGEYWNQHPELCHRFAVEDKSIVRDIDHAKGEKS